MEAMPLEIKLALAVLFLPLLAFAIQIFFGKKLYDLHPQGGHIVPILGIGAGLGISLYLFFTQVMTGGGMEPRSLHSTHGLPAT